MSNIGDKSKFYFGHHRLLVYGEGVGASERCLIDSAHGVQHSLQPQPKVDSWRMNRWYYHSDSLINTVDDYVHKWFREFLVHGTVWTGVSDNATHQSQRLTVKPLKSSDWPSDPLGPSWPSFPSIPEWMEMLRKGIDPFSERGLDMPKGDAGFTRISRSEVQENPALAARIVANAIVGIRSSIEIPEKFRRYFRYRQNFLILTATYALPIGLVRFLLSQWTVKPYSLWLRRSCTLKKFLRKVPSSLVRQARLRLAAYSSEEYLAEDGSCTQSEDGQSEFYSEGSSFLD